MKFNPIFKCQKFCFKWLHVVLMFFFLTIHNTFYARDHKPFVVVLDAGHGGKDPGKVGYRGFKEKDIALSIVLKTGKILETIPNVKVLYTRKSDVFVDLWKRGNIANEADADLFVSIHCNAHNSQAIGSETWVLGLHANERNFRVAKAENEVILQEENHQERYQGFDPKSPTSVIGLSLEQEEYLDQSLLLASFVQNEFEKSLKRVNRGVKQAGFVVLYQTYMPSVLIETGFLTHKKEGNYLHTKSGQKEMATSIARSIQQYYERQQLNVATDDFLEDVNIAETNKTSKIGQPYYKIQIASGKNKIKTAPYNFKGLKNVERIKMGAYYKYFLKDLYDQNQANLVLSKVKSKGYTSAFLVAFGSDNSKKKSIKTKANTSKVYYKVQIASSKNKIATTSSNFRGLKSVNAVKVGSYYKYYLGKTTSYQKAKKYLQMAKSKKYASAFLVAFLNNKRISLKQALQIKTN